LVSELWSYGIFFELLPPHLHDGIQGTHKDPSPVHHHVHYGFMLAITATLLVQRIFSNNDQLWLKVLFGVFFVTATANIFINAGRTGYFLFATLMLSLFLLSFRERILVAAGVSISIIAVSFMMAYHFSETFKNRFDTTVNSIQSMYLHDNFRSSLGTRAFVVLSSKNIILDTWAFGNGTGDQLDVVKNNVKAIAPDYLGMVNGLKHLHSEYLNALVQFGVLGLLAFLYIPFQLFRYPQNDVNKKNMLSILAVAILSFGVIEIVVQGLGALLTVVLLVSLALKNYIIDNAKYSPMRLVGCVKYGLAISLMEIVSWYS
ncbi:O-antigen ligase family protein, partial [Kaarinaea lacus]